MKRNSPIALLLVWITLALAAHPAAQSAGNVSSGSTQARSGSITGRIHNFATGNYLNSARVAVRGTDLSVLSDPTGTYRLNNVPSGPVVIEVYYTGLDPQTISLNVAEGQTIVQNVDLTSVARYGESSVVRLDSVVVASSREMDSQALAIGEQRFAPNIKNVVSADAHGDVAEGNVAEFMKYLPGVNVVYGDAAANSISIRGLGSDLTGISVDGARMAHAINAGDSRVFDFKQVSINDYSRVEVTKVPTPSTPADSLAGSVNLVSKSAFERRTPEFRYRVLLDMNSEHLTLKKTPFSYEKNTYKAMPGFNLSYTNPVSENFGYVLTAASNTQFNPQSFFTTTWNTTGTGVSATPATPYLQTYQIVDAPKYYYRHSIGLTADWRVTRNSVLSVGMKASYYRDDNGNQNWSVNAGTIAAPTVATGTAMTYGPTFTNGATGRGTVTMGGGLHHITQVLLAPNIRHRFDNGLWRIESAVNYSKSKNHNRHLKYGHFNSLAVGLREPARVVFNDIKPDGPTSINVYNNANQLIDLSDINNYNLTTAATGSIRDIRDEIESGELNIRRELPVFSFPINVQAGGAIRIQTRDSKIPSRTYTYNGMNGDQSAARFAATVFRTTTPFGFKVPYASAHRAYDAWAADPRLFTFSPAQLAANYVSQVTSSLYIQEEISAFYAQTEMRFLKNRLHLLTGARYEKVTTDGAGPLIDNAAVWRRNADGSFARNAAGARIRRDDAGANNSLEQRLLTHTERGSRAGKSYDGYYPSLHTTYNITNNLLARLAYARTYGRPNFTEIIPNSTVDEEDIDAANNPTASRGRITLRNPSLKPWTADNYDLSLEYYTDAGGMFSAGVFRKDLSDFFGNAVRVATAADVEEFGLDERFIGWTVTTSYNAGDARVSGVEFNITHSLARFGDWGRNVSAFVNGTKLRLEGHDEADFRGFVPEMLNWGFTITRRPITFMAKWNYRSEDQRAPVAGMGPNAFQFRAARTVLDLNIDYQINTHMSLFANGRNVLNRRWIFENYGPQTPDYARQNSTRNYGVQFATGIKGAF